MKITGANSNQKVETIQIIKLFTQCFFKCLYTRKLSDITAQTENNAHFWMIQIKEIDIH